ncbi:MAG: sel1 repeat family protein [Deltaproteobacteria bacterium]|jgi:TPR repeat protein|nr:sel1 repeat family protein [Deltaproteobacteria bacterium]
MKKKPHPYSWLLKLANEGDPKAQFELAFRLAGGQGFKQDSDEAARWFLSAAELGLPEAQNELGSFFLYGDEGFPQNESLAAKWFLAAAEQGFAESQLSLGQMLRDGVGIPKDEAEGKKWLDLAAKNGLTEDNAADENGLPEDNSDADDDRQ